MCESRLIRLSVTWNNSDFWNAANCGGEKEKRENHLPAGLAIGVKLKFSGAKHDAGPS